MTHTTTVDGFDQALRQCGVTKDALAARQKEALDRHGYVVLADIVDDDWLNRLRAAFETALARGKRQGVHVHLDWHDPVFDGVYTHPQVLAAAHHVLGRPFKAGGVVGRDPAAGHGQQALHADWPRTASDPFLFVTALWLLDDFTPRNGATRVVPGSHRAPNALPKRMAQPESRHPEQQVVIATAGSVLVFNGHLLHSGTRNESGQRRRVLQAPFVLRMPHLGDTQPEIPARLSAAARCILGEEPSSS